MILLATHYSQLLWVISSRLVLTGFTPEITLILLICSNMGISPSAFPTVCILTMCGAGRRPGIGAQVTHEKLGNVGGLSKRTVERPKNEALNYKSLWRSDTGEPLSQLVLSSAFHLVTFCFCNLFNIVNEMLCECNLSTLYTKAWNSL